MRTSRALIVLLIVVASGWVAGCHPEVELTPLPEAKISIIGDRFFDVKALSAERALVIGYRGKILETTDGGRTWNIIKTPTDRALYSIRFADAQNGWICGQGGLMLNTKDGGKTWTEQKSNTETYLFAVYAVSPTHVYAVGDKSTLVETTDGGANWTVRKVAQSSEGISEDIALAVQDPIFYDIEFADEQHGWIVGEFGTIRHTTDGGQTWVEQQKSLLGERHRRHVRPADACSACTSSTIRRASQRVSKARSRTPTTAETRGRSPRSTRRSRSRIRCTRRSSSPTAKDGWSARAARS